MKLYTIGTGSSGNCYLLVDGNDILILDAGVNPTQRISKYLYDLRPAIPCGCLVTHEHGDHSCAVPGLVRMGIACYGSPGTAERVGFGMKAIRPYDPSWISQDVKPFGDAFLVMAFKTNHDAAEPCGFLITNTKTGERMIYATDTYYMTYRFPGIHYWLIECNYCEELLTEDTPPVLARRLSTSHMSLDRLCQVFQANDLSPCRKIVLIHTSHDRGDPKMMLKRIRDQTHKPVEVTRAGYMHELTLDPF